MITTTTKNDRKHRTDPAKQIPALEEQRAAAAIAHQDAQDALTAAVRAELDTRPYRRALADAAARLNQLDQALTAVATKAQQQQIDRAAVRAQELVSHATQTVARIVDRHPIPHTVGTAP